VSAAGLVLVLSATVGILLVSKDKSIYCNLVRCLLNFMSYFFLPFPFPFPTQLNSTQLTFQGLCLLLHQLPQASIGGHQRSSHWDLRDGAGPV